jgi:hypothetical protein
MSLFCSDKIVTDVVGDRSASPRGEIFHGRKCFLSLLDSKAGGSTPLKMLVTIYQSKWSNNAEDLSLR